MVDRKKPHRDNKTLHPLYSAILLHMAEADGISAKQLCDSRQLERLQSRQDPRWFAALLLKLLREKPALSRAGFEYGRHLDLAAAGVIGQAVASAPTLGAAFDLMCRYYPLTGLYLEIERQRVGSEVVVTFAIGYDNMPQDVSMHILEAVLASWHVCTKTLCGIGLPAKKLCFDFPEPDYSDKYREFFNCEVLFDCPRNSMTVDAEIITLATLTANAVVHERAVASCDEALLKQGMAPTITNQVRKHIKVLDNLSAASLATVASKMNLSARTLNRRLQAEGAGFQTLMDEQLCQRACLLLAHSNNTLDRIADELGYSDASNFRRAFKKWTGNTPTAFRKASH